MSFLRIVIGIAALIIGVGGAGAKDWTVVRIGIEGAYPPFSSYTSSHKLVGFDVDIANALCARMKVKCIFVRQEWDGMIPALVHGKFDAIVSSMSITEERKQFVDFTDKYYTNSLTFVARKDSGLSDVSPAGLAGKALGAQGSSVSSAFLKKTYKHSDIRLYDWGDDAYFDLADGQIDAVLADAAQSIGWLASSEGRCCTFVGKAVVKEDLIGIAVRKEDDDLTAMLNKAIAAIVADGTYRKINDKYFPFSIY